MAWLAEAKGGRSYEVALRRSARLAVKHLVAEEYPTLLGVGKEEFRCWLRRAALDAGIEIRVYPHLLRHSFGAALARTATPDEWRIGMGHSDLSQFARYTHTDRARVLDATERAKVF